jgi:hypothetical protein
MNDLVTINQNPIIGSDAAFGISDSDKLEVYYLKLIQQINATEEWPAGTFVDPKMPELPSRRKLKIVPLSLDFGRAKMPPKTAGFTSNNRPICKSYDRITPANGRDLIPQSTNCAVCQFGQWDKVGGRNIPPECGENSTITFLDLDTQFVYALQVGGHNNTVVNELQKSFIRMTRLAKATGKVFVPFQQVYELSSQRVQKTGAIYLIHFSAPTPIQDAGIAQLAFDTFNQLQDRKKKPRLEEAEINPVDKKIEDDGEVPFDIPAIEA